MLRHGRGRGAGIGTAGWNRFSEGNSWVANRLSLEKREDRGLQRGLHTPQKYATFYRVDVVGGMA